MNTLIENKKAVIQSVILAKALAVRESDQYEAICVHEKSTQNEFYWVYTLKSRKSARKYWKLTRTYPRDLSPRDWNDFDSFLAHYAQNNGAQIFPLRIQKSRKLALSRSHEKSSPYPIH